MNLLNFKSPGPVSSAFLNDRSPFSAIRGPMGSAKTSTCIMKTVNIASEMPVSRITGERLFKWGVVRDTLTNLKRTTMKSIESWFGTSGDWGGGGSSSEPPFFKAGFRLPDGTICRYWMEFVGLDTHNVEQLAKGWEVSGYWLNEGDLLPKDVKDMLDGRVGRYPGAQHCMPHWMGGIMDYNAPDVENWAYELFEELQPEGHVPFVQPGGLDPHAENLENLPPDYYQRMIIGKEDWWIRRNVHNLYGFSRDGKPVYMEYRDDYHCAPAPLMPVAGLVIRCDFDQGLHPACILRQSMPNGQLRVLDELYSDGGGAKGLTDDLKRLIGSSKYAGCRVIGGRCDPAANARDQNDAESWVDCVNRLMGWRGNDRVRVADTNAPDKRQAAVRHRLKTTVDDARPGLLISPTCRSLRKGFNSEYCFKRRVAAGGYADEPDKTKRPYADLHDALQYGALDDGGFEEIVGREKRRAGGFGMRTAKVEVRV